MEKPCKGMDGLERAGGSLMESPEGGWASGWGASVQECLDGQERCFFLGLRLIHSPSGSKFTYLALLGFILSTDGVSTESTCFIQ